MAPDQALCDVRGADQRCERCDGQTFVALGTNGRTHTAPGPPTAFARCRAALSSNEHPTLTNRNNEHLSLAEMFSIILTNTIL